MKTHSFNRLRWFHALITILAALLVSAGAFAADSPAPKQKIAVVISTLNNPWFVVLANTAKDRAIELGYDATIFDSQNDTAKEASHFPSPTSACNSILSARDFFCACRWPYGFRWRWS